MNSGALGATTERLPGDGSLRGTVRFAKVGAEMLCEGKAACSLAWS